MTNRTPPYLIAGNKVAIVSSARKISKAELAPAIDVIKSWGLEPVLGPNVYSVDRQFAGSDEQRAKDLQWALDDPEINAVFFARGGYGTVRLLNLLDFSQFQKHPKWLVGFSDLTILLAYVQKHFKIEGLHAAMPVTYPTNTTEAIATVRQALFGKLRQIEALTIAVSEGACEGALVGGNLSMIYSSLGTPEQPDTYGAILFLEDLDEHLYHVDRMAQAMKRAGFFDGISGLILGGLNDMCDKIVADGFKNDDPFGRSAEEILLEAVGRNDIPICSGFPVGHIPDNRCLIIGRKIKMAVGKTTILNFA